MRKVAALIATSGALFLSSCSGEIKNEPEALAHEAPLQTAEKSQQASAANAPENKLSFQQQNAARSAENYIEMSGFSRAGLINQLSSDAGDRFEKADAEVAVDSLNVDWNEQAARSAKNYLDISGFSCAGLVQQLSSSAGDKYTKEQAAFGAQQVGACQ